MIGAVLPRIPIQARWELTLYVAGQTAKSLQAFANLKRICEEHLAGEYHIEVIDLMRNPQLARGDQILACANFRNRSARLSAIFPTPSACSWGSISARATRRRMHEQTV